MATKNFHATDSASELHDLIGDDATATFENDPKFIDADPTATASSENVEEQRDTDDIEEDDEDEDDLDDEDLDDEDLDDDDEDDEEDDFDDDEDDDDEEEDDEDEVGAAAAAVA